jgi:Tannase and feruloyl esterase
MTPKRIFVFLALAIGATALLACGDPAQDAPATSAATAEAKSAEARCSTEAFRAFPDVRLASVTEQARPVAHCKVVGVIGAETNFELLLPDEWNGKFVFGGGGGFVGSVVNTALGYGVLQKGYATVGTDTGHRGSAIDASWALNNLERIVSFGHQAVHRTTVTAKALIGDYYGRDSSSNLFFGCSRGGGQALMEAQRYPNDFDGIVAGAPAYNWTEELGGRNIWINQAMYPDPDELGVATITPDARLLIGTAVMQQCDGLDGLEDGVLNNPLACDLDVSGLACEAGAEDAGACLSPPQLEAARRAYAGFVLDGEQVIPGYAPGAELGAGGWERWIAGGFDVLELDEFQRGVEEDPDYPDPDTPNAHFAFGNGVMKYLVFHDPDWDYSTYDFSTFRSDVAAVSSTLDATDPNLDAFRAQGGKLLLYNGWRDMALTPLGTIDYYEKVMERDATAADDMRLIMVPGMDHCFGGPGPSLVDWVDEIDNWVETDQAPDHVTAYFVDEQMQPDGARLACAWPSVLQYDGAGDPKDAASFSCVEAE